ncbi:unnamed protein product [Clavelina lepadiformis]|uniref:Connective tissue growth factor n=1 Tax=Clavelina lepadiformis TaxID=159417 RepID=A0ABP0FWR5_CLALP
MLNNILLVIFAIAVSSIASQRHRSNANPRFDLAHDGHSERDFYLSQNNSTECEECVCPQTPTCSPGISLVEDGCECCKVCARQLGESCDAKHVCDYHKGLFCDPETRVCKASPGRPCNVQGRPYGNGELFQLNCRATCSCIDGDLGCFPTCTTPRFPPASLSCTRPRLIRRKGKCCGEWICPKGGKLGKNVLRFDNEVRGRPKTEVTFRNSCMVQTTEWSPCSKTCGFGISDRVTNDNEDCKLEKQTRLCNLRPCSMTEASVTSRKRTCRKNVKHPKRVQFSLSGCISSAIYRPKYCGFCRNKCCRPKLSKTITVEFECREGSEVTSTFTRKMMWIKKCYCEDCVNENDIFSIGYGVGMGNDVARLT